MKIYENVGSEYEDHHLLGGLHCIDFRGICCLCPQIGEKYGCSSFSKTQTALYKVAWWYISEEGRASPYLWR
jgi:hypothetical protein